MIVSLVISALICLINIGSYVAVIFDCLHDDCRWGLICGVSTAASHHIVRRSGHSTILLSHHSHIYWISAATRQAPCQAMVSWKLRTCKCWSRCCLFYMLQDCKAQRAGLKLTNVHLVRQRLRSGISDSPDLLHHVATRSACHACHHVSNVHPTITVAQY